MLVLFTQTASKLSLAEYISELHCLDALISTNCGKANTCTLADTVLQRVWYALEKQRGWVSCWVKEQFDVYERVREHGQEKIARLISEKWKNPSKKAWEQEIQVHATVVISNAPCYIIFVHFDYHSWLHEVEQFVDCIRGLLFRVFCVCVCFVLFCFLFFGPCSLI